MVIRLLGAVSYSRVITIVLVLLPTKKQKTRCHWLQCLQRRPQSLATESYFYSSLMMLCRVTA